MKSVALIVILFAGFFLATDYVSKCSMGTIESGLPDGGHGKFADYHDNQLKSCINSFSETNSPPEPPIGEVNLNPYIANE